MADWTGWFNTLNETQISTWGQAATYQSRSGNVFPVTFIQSDPLRKEETLPGNFTFGFINENDLIAAGCTPIKGDTLTVTGTDYKVEQVQVDAAFGVHLMLLKTQ